MNCNEARIPLAAFVDGELSAWDQARLEAHLRGCATCQRRRQAQWFASDEVRRGAIRHGSPHSLRRRMGGLAASGPERPAPSPRAWRWPALALPSWPAPMAAFMAASLVAGAFLVAKPGAEERIAADALSSHVRAMLAASAIDVVSSDQHTVKPWFSGRIDYSPPVADFADEGFVLLGARRDYVGGRTVATLVYQCRQHVVDVFVWPSAKAAGPPKWLTPRDGYQLLHWDGDGMTYWAVSDLEIHDLERLQRLLANPRNP